MEYRNVPQAIGLAISTGKASLFELSTSLGSEDLADILEIIAVDAWNNRPLDPTD